MSSTRPASLVYANRSNKQHFDSRFEHQAKLIDNLKEKVTGMEECFHQLQQAQPTQVNELMEQISQLKTLMTDSIANVEQKLRADITNLEKTLVARMSSMIPTSDQSTKFHGTTANKLAFQLADDVDSVVGLKEAITWKYRWLKRIWAAMLLVGIVATAWLVCATAMEYLEEPTATKVKMIPHTSYDYPPILLCPSAWLDVPKAFSKGLSIDGLKYSLGYIYGWADIAKPDNSTSTRARKEFFDFYDKNNFTSFDDYLDAISVDVHVQDTHVGFSANFTTSAFCDVCNASVLPKLVIDGTMCYNFQLTPEQSRRSRVDPFISLKVVDRSMGLVENSQCKHYVGANLALRTQSVPLILMQPFDYGSIRITPQHFSNLNTDQSPCESKEHDDEHWSETCVAKCLCPLYKENLNCAPYDLTTKNSSYHPRELCNVVGDESSFWTLEDSYSATINEVLASKKAEQCHDKCPQTYQRKIYESRRQQGYGLANFNSDWRSFVSQAKQLNMTLVGLQIENAAVDQGGITTWTEVSTISLTSVIGNVGGALGLFVGGTIMTFVQVIMSLVKFALEKCGKKAAIENVEVINTSAA